MVQETVGTRSERFFFFFLVKVLHCPPIQNQPRGFLTNTHMVQNLIPRWGSASSEVDFSEPIDFGDDPKKVGTELPTDPSIVDAHEDFCEPNDFGDDLKEVGSWPPLSTELPTDPSIVDVHEDMSAEQQQAMQDHSAFTNEQLEALGLQVGESARALSVGEHPRMHPMYVFTFSCPHDRAHGPAHSGR